MPIGEGDVSINQLHLPHRDRTGPCEEVFRELEEMVETEKEEYHIWVGDWNRFAPTHKGVAEFLGVVGAEKVSSGAEDRLHNMWMAVVKHRTVGAYVVHEEGVVDHPFCLGVLQWEVHKGVGGAGAYREMSAKM